MLMHPGDKLHIITRHLFENDLRRHFIGEVQTVGEHAIRVKGYVYVFDRMKNQFIRRDDMRVRIFTLLDAGLIYNVIPTEVDIENVHYKFSDENHLIVTDDKHFTLDLDEFI